METRDILDYQGNVVGELTLSSDTTEDQWIAALSPYARAPVTPSLEQYIQAKIVAAQTLGRQIVLEAKTGNVALGVTAAGKTKDVSDFLSELSRYLNEGSLTVVPPVVDALISGGIPDDIASFVTEERLIAVKNRVQDFLRIPRT